MGVRLMLRAVAYFLVFATAYSAASFWLFPSAWTDVLAWSRLALAPTVDHVSAKSASPPDTTLPLDGAFELLSGPRIDHRDRTTLWVVFDLKCGHAPASVGFWKRLAEQVAKRGVPTLVASCADSPSEVVAFARAQSLLFPVYYSGRCDAVPTSIDVKGGIHLYLVDRAGKLIHAWAGRPIFRYAENDAIAQALSRIPDR